MFYIVLYKHRRLNQLSYRVPSCPLLADAVEESFCLNRLKMKKV